MKLKSMKRENEKECKLIILKINITKKLEYITETAKYTNLVKYPQKILT